MDIRTQDTSNADLSAADDTADDGSVPEVIADSISHSKITHKRPLRTKNKEAVEFVLEDGTNLSGFIFVGLDERVLDCLNDSRPFFPFLTEDGEMLILAKDRIAVCRPLGK